MSNGITLRKNEERQRYEVLDADQVVGFATYVGDAQRLVFPHFEIDPNRRGSGLANQLAKYALDDVRASGGRIEPVCPFLVTYLRRHPNEADLLADGVALT